MNSLEVSPRMVRTCETFSQTNAPWYVESIVARLRGSLRSASFT